MQTMIGRLPLALTMLCLASNIVLAQQVVRVTEAEAINPAEVTIAINPKNPDNIVAASFQTGRPPRPRASSYYYLSMDGGKTWKKTLFQMTNRIAGVPTPNHRIAIGIHAIGEIGRSIWNSGLSV